MKTFAIACKILAGIIWVGIACLKISNDITGWEFSDFWWALFELLMLLVLAFLAIAPNRWFVVSPKKFAVALFFALFPFFVVVAYNWMSRPSLTVGDFFQPGALANAAVTFGSLPVSLALSFWRKQKGEPVGYA